MWHGLGDSCAPLVLRFARVLMNIIDGVTVVDREMVRVKLKITFDDGGIRHLTDELTGDIVKALNAEGSRITRLLMGAQEGVHRTNEKRAVQEGPAQAAR